MATTVRPVGFTNSVQTLAVYPFSPLSTITASLWGGGGGGGGSDSSPGGAGTGGGFAQVQFGVNYGDVLTLAIGGGGGVGGSGSSQPGGSGGPSNIGYAVFNSRQLTGSGVAPVSLPYSWSNFMNAYAVWNTNGAYTFDVSTTITAPITGVYVLQTAFDDVGYVYIDGALVASSSGSYSSSVTDNITVTGGAHTLRILAYNSGGGPAGAAVSLQSGTSYSGAPGGASGPGGGSGAGGGGGGATILVWNSSIQAAAAGGGGGGGGGNGVPGGTAPGPNGQTDSGFNGEYGSDHPGDGGGGGGGGGGFNGGSGGGGNGGAYGGYPGSADVGGQAGSVGNSWSASSSIAANPDGRIPYQYTGYQPGVGLGGAPGVAGNSGYAIVYMDVPGVFVNQNGVYYATKEVYVKDNGIWKITNAVYIKRNGVWSPVSGQQTTNFATVSGGFGMVGRPSPYTYSPIPDTPSGGGGNDYYREHYLNTGAGTVFGGPSDD